MPKFIRSTKKQLSKMERGQVLVVVAAAIVGLIAVMGLALDVGMVFISDARLRRAVDAAALASALQFREGYTQQGLASAAEEFLTVNGIPFTSVSVDTCATDSSLCTSPERKLVRVIATARAPLAFLPVVGINDAPIAAEAISETASVDVVLVIDRSESMTYGTSTNPVNIGNPMRDPSVCNALTSPEGNVGDCEPFNTVKNAAISFVNQLYFPYDRVSLITFDTDPHVITDLSNDKNQLISDIRSLTVYEGAPDPADPSNLNGELAVYPNGNPSRYYANGDYEGLGCPQADTPSDPNFPSPVGCTTTNIGGGLQAAGNEFAIPPIRQQSLWVVVLLTDGVANAGYGGSPVSYYCPSSTYPNPVTSYNPPNVPFYCNDAISTTRHGSANPTQYDAEDFAYDMADFVALPSPVGQNALLFTIGLGPQVTMASPVDGTMLGQIFLQYAANTGHGLYYNAPDATQLEEIFRKIAENIATRLAH